MRLIRTAVLAATIVAVAAPYAGAATPGPLDPKFKRQNVYFHCVEPRLTNVQVAAGDPVPSWNTSYPAGSVTDGYGCATADVFTPVVVSPQENPVDGVWSGTYTGNFDSMTINLHMMASTTQALAVAAVPSLGIRLTVDGETAFDSSDDPVEVIANGENSGITEGYTVTIKDLGFIEPNDDTDGDGIGDNPFGTIEHTLTLTVDGRSAGVQTLGNWVFDTTEVPAGISFNPAYLIPPIVSAAPAE